MAELQTRTTGRERQNLLPTMGAFWRPFAGFIPILATRLFLGALFWAKAQDPFWRRRFTLKTAGQPPARGIAVLPKPVRHYPVVV